MSVVTKQVSLDGKWFYLKDGPTVPTGWLSLTGEADRNGMDWLPFAFWDVKKGQNSPASDDEIARYEARNASLSKPRPVPHTAEDLPISAEVFDEAVHRVFDYTMNPKREAEIRYIVRYAKHLQEQRKQAVDAINELSHVFLMANPEQAFDPVQIVHHVKSVITERDELQRRLDTAEEVIKELQSQLGS